MAKRRSVKRHKPRRYYITHRALTHFGCSRSRAIFRKVFGAREKVEATPANLLKYLRCPPFHVKGPNPYLAKPDLDDVGFLMEGITDNVSVPRPKGKKARQRREWIKWAKRLFDKAAKSEEAGRKNGEGLHYVKPL
jgi:hypothetical protein